MRPFTTRACHACAGLGSTPPLPASCRRRGQQAAATHPQYLRLAGVIARAAMHHGAFAMHDAIWRTCDAGAPHLSYALVAHADPKQRCHRSHLPHQLQRNARSPLAGLHETIHGPLITPCHHVSAGIQNAHSAEFCQERLASSDFGKSAAGMQRVHVQVVDRPSDSGA